MQLKRDNFGTESLAAMDQVARLLYVAEQSMALIRTFENNPHKKAAINMRAVVEFANSTSSMLMEALFHVERKRADALKKARQFARSKVGEAIEAARKLALMEKARTDHSGTVISHAVLPNLELLRKEWDGERLDGSDEKTDQPRIKGFRSVPSIIDSGIDCG